MPLELAPFRFHGWLGNRKTQSFGWRYDFDDASFRPTGSAARLAAPIARKRPQRSPGLTPDEFVHVLLARYDPGAGIGWHRDRDVFENVVGVSLNTPAVLRFRQRAASGFRRASVEVVPRSAYLLSGQSRWQWEHALLRAMQLRFSITFSSLVRQRPAYRRAASLSGTLRLRNGFAVMRKPLLLLLVLAGCSKGPQADLPAIGAARSLGAEWALVNQEASRGQLTGGLRENDAAAAARTAPGQCLVADPA